MLRKLRTHFRQQFIGYSALFIALSGSAYAAASLPANSVGSSQLKNNAVTTPKLKNGVVTRTKLNLVSLGTLPRADHANNADNATHATSADKAAHADVATDADVLDGWDSADLVHGRGSLLSNRLVFLPQDNDRLLLAVPGLGEVRAACSGNLAAEYWVNTTGSNVDGWWESNGGFGGAVAHDQDNLTLGFSGSAAHGASAGGTISLGIGNDPGARRVATLHGFAYQSADNAPCGFQVQGTLWASP